MRRRTLAAIVFALALCGAGVWAWWGRARELPVPRNVLLLTIDTLRADRLGCYGSKRGLTPALDALAADGVRFERAYTPVPLTAPSHATMLTGDYPMTHGLRNNGSESLPDGDVLLPEILHERGFKTAAIVSSLVLSSDFGLNQGFDLYYEDDIKGGARGTGLWYDQRPADKTVDRALNWLGAEAERPFFLWVHLFDPHDPYDPPSPYKEKYAAAPYDGEVAFADAQAGRLLEALRLMGRYDDTLIVMAGDHGEGLGDHKEQYHGIFLYDTTMHVPLIVRVPGGRRGLVVKDLASTMDIAPTVLEALKLLPPGPMQGVSLLPAVRGGRIPARSLFLETIYPSASYGWATVRALLEPAWKFVELPRAELYDLTADPAETKNIHDAQPARAGQMKESYERTLADLQSAQREAGAAAIDDETRDRLLSLGYVSGQQSKARADAGRDPKEVSFMIAPLNIATGLLKSGKNADAEEVFRKALEFDPENKIALLKIGQALAALRRVDEAIPFFERAVQTYPDVEEIYRTYGWALLRAGRMDAAQALIKRALAHLPESAQMHYMLGYAAFLKQDWAQAAPELDLAARLSPKAGRPHYLLAICRAQAGDDAAALAELEKYLRRNADVESLFFDPYFARLRGRPEFQDLLKKYL